MIDQKEKNKLMQDILKDFPEIQYDNLKKHYIENLIDCYYNNPKAFRDNAYNNKNNIVETTKLPNEFLCITKIEADNK